jgi:dipeptidyl aminopeptidase/acylaminoacyl peptidase
MACDPISPVTDLSSKVIVLGFVAAPPGATFSTPTYLPPTGDIVVAIDPPGRQSGAEGRLYAFQVDGSGQHQLDLPNQSDCLKTTHSNPGLLPDGRLAYLSHCIGTTPRVPQRANRIIAFDPRSAETAQLVPYDLHANVFRYAFNPDGSRWVINDGQSLFESLDWLEPDGPRKVDLPLQRVGAPSWSPDGKLIAVPGAPQGPTAQGSDRLDLPQHLYVFSPDDLKLRPLAEDLRPVSKFNWSADSRWLAGTFRRSDKTEALYLVNVGTGRAYLVLAGKETGEAAWLPDGRRLIVSVGVYSHEPLIPPVQVRAEQVGVLIVGLPDLGAFP